MRSITALIDSKTKTAANFLTTFVAVLAAVPVAAAIWPNPLQHVQAENSNDAAKGVVTAAADSCSVPKASTTTAVKKVVTPAHFTHHFGGTSGGNGGGNGGGAGNGNVNNGLVQAVVGVNDLVDVNNNSILNGNTVNVPVLSGNNTLNHVLNGNLVDLGDLL